MRRAFLFSVLLTVAGLLAGLLVAEIALRVMGRASGKRSYLVADPVLHHRLEPKTQKRVGEIEYAVNSLGLRDREYSPQKPPGVFRTLMLGDSFTEGLGLPLEQTVAKQAEAMLNDGRCRATHEVLNAGVRSHSPILEYLVLQRLGPRLTPDLVVLNFDMTDVHDDWLRTQVATLDARRLPLAVPSDRVAEDAILMPHVALPAALGFLAPVERAVHRSAVYQLVRKSKLGERFFGGVRLTPERLEQLALAGDIQYDSLAITREVDSPKLRQAWQLTERYVAAIRRSAQAGGAAFALVVYPHAHQVSASESPVGRQHLGMGPGFFPSERPFRILEDFGRREGFPVISLLDLFRARHASEGALFREADLHHNPKGARVFAEGIVGGLVERGLLPRCQPTRPPVR